MNKMTLPALALIALCSTAYAAEPASTAAAAAPTAADCTALQKQYDAANKSHVAADKLKKANAKRATGASECASGKVADGVKNLKSALKMIK